MNRLLLRPFKRVSLAGFSTCTPNFLNGLNAAYIDGLYDSWHSDPNSVSAQWDSYFQQITKQGEFDFVPEPLGGQLDIQLGTQASLNSIQGDHVNLRRLINLYRIRGHEQAELDPIKLNTGVTQIGKPKGETRLDYRRFFTEKDLDREFYVNDQQSKGITVRDKPMTLRQIIDQLEKIYCGKVGYEYMHLNNIQQRNWIRTKIEDYDVFTPTKDEKLLTFDRLCKEHCFTYYLSNKFSTSKRFGIEGCDSMISGMQKLVDVMAKDKVSNIVFGMAHRGRLNTLYSVFDKSAEEILAEFQDLKAEYTEEWGQSGDVKYHLGQVNYVYQGDHKVRLEMLPNASHLESVNPIVYGKARALQDLFNDETGSEVAAVLVHGDASICGQGIVYESFQMADLINYTSRGLIHVVANNQIGFTTVPQDSRSSLYCTDIAQSIQAPVFHVNADEPELVDKVFEIAAQFRQEFKKDVFIDLVGYRRFGHNELDQPQFTQPLMYNNIQNRPNVFKLYSDKLVKDGILTQEQVDQAVKTKLESLEKSYVNSRNKEFNIKQVQNEPYENIQTPKLWGRIKDTGVPQKVLKDLALTINEIPKDLNTHKLISKFYEQRKQCILNDEGFDFATAEALAFATLLKEGYGVRVSGQDVERATFSHRHALLHDQKDPNKTYVPLRSILGEKDKNKFLISNSHLSEFGVLGFDYGYSLCNPNYLVCWEAQFGDFANGAQIITDQYVVSAESKWGIQCGIVMLLPHGMDGQGPEHSSARLERYLQLSDDDPTLYEKDQKLRLRKQNANTNIQIVQCTTPSNYFHVLRRQMRRQFRKPLILGTSKRLLRYVKAVSKLEDIDEGKRFDMLYPEAYPEQIRKPSEIKRVILCSGQVYYDLLTRREETKNDNIAIIRIEQLAPFPYYYLQQIINQYVNAEFVWVQEEHENYGPWTYVRPRINKVLFNMQHSQSDLDSVRVVCREPNSSPAVGNSKVHERTLQKLLMEAIP